MGLIKTFWNLVLFRASPQAVPYSLSILGVLIVGNFSLELSDFGPPYAWSAQLILCSFAWLAAFLWGCLSLAHLRERFVKTYLAIMGALLIQLLLNSVLNALLPLSWENTIDWVMFIWGLAVLTHIFRYALETRLIYAALLVILFEAMRFGLLWLLYTLSS